MVVGNTRIVDSSPSIPTFDDASVALGVACVVLGLVVALGGPGLCALL